MTTSDLGSKKTSLFALFIFLTVSLSAALPFLFWLEAPNGRSNPHDPKSAQYAPHLFFPTAIPTATPTATPNLAATQTAVALLPPPTQTAIAVQATQTQAAQATQTTVAHQTQTVAAVATQTAVAVQATQTHGSDIMKTAVALVNSASFLPGSAKAAIVAQVTQTGVVVMTEVARSQLTQTQLVVQVQQTAAPYLPAATQTALADQVSTSAQAVETLEAGLQATQTLVAAPAALTAVTQVMQTVVAVVPAATLTALASLPGQISDGVATQVATLTPNPGDPWPIETAAAIEATQTGVAAATSVAQVQATLTQVGLNAVLTAEEQILETVTPSVPDATLTAVMTQTVIPMETQLASLAGTQVAAETAVAQAAQTAEPGIEPIGATLANWSPTVTPSPTP